MTDVDELSAGELFEQMEAPLSEAASRVVVPKKGKLFEEDGSLKVAIIRPCVSRGKRIGREKLPPIYTPAMLERNAAVFVDWPMYEDHLAEEVVENFSERLAEAKMGDLLEHLQERVRRIKELGGRVRESYWQSDVTFRDDDEYGFQPGAIVGEVIPQPRVQSMLERDPEILNVSINAWPSGAKVGTAPWAPSTRGMVIEGILRKPRGSVDWVFRGGAGGRLLLEGLAEKDWSQVGSNPGEAYYADHGVTAATIEQKILTELKDLKPDQLREYLQENDLEHLIPALVPESSGNPPAPKPGNGGGGISEEQLQAALDRHSEKLTETFEEKLEEAEVDVEDQVQEELSRRTEATKHQGVAFDLLEKAQRDGLPRGWTDKLKQRYSVIADGPGLSNLQEEEREEDGKKVTLSVEEVLKERVKADIQEAVNLIQEAGGAPRLKNLGASKPDPNGQKAGPGKRSSFRSGLSEMGFLEKTDKDGKPVPESEQIREMVEESAG